MPYDNAIGFGRGERPALVIGIGVVLAAYARVWYGVDIADEGFHVAVPWVFSLGARPFADEFLIQQTAGLVTAPLAGLYRSVTGGSAGIVLYFRHLYFLLSLCSAAALYVMVRRIATAPLAWMSALIAVVGIPFSTPTLSYNTLAAHGFTIGICLGIAGATERRIGMLITSACALVVASFAYVTFLPAVIVAAITIAILARESRSRIAFAATLLGLLIVAGALLMAFGLPAIQRSVHLSLAYGIHGGNPLTKLREILGQFRPLFRYLPVIAIAMGAMALIAWFTTGRSRIFASILLLLLLGFYTPSAEQYAQHVPMIYGPVLLAPFVWRVAARRRLAAAVGVPTVLAALVVAMTSANGLWNTALVTAPALVVGICIGEPADEKPRTFYQLATAALIILILRGTWIFAFNDLSPMQLHARVANGPYAGLRTSPETAALLEVLHEDVRTVAGGRRTIFFFDDMPAGYLFSNLRPAGPTLWVVPQNWYARFDRHFYVDYFSKTVLPDVVFDFRAIPIRGKMVPVAGLQQDPLRAFLGAHHYRLITARAAYTSYVH